MGDIARMERVGGHPAIDFVNTLGGRPDDPDDEYLFDYADVVIFAEGSGLLGPPASDRLRRTAARSRFKASAVLVRALDLRGSLDRILRAQVEARPASRSDLDAVREAYVTALSSATVSKTGGHYDWDWPDLSRSLELPLWPIAAEAVELLRLGPLDRIARCGHCRWLFLDTSRSHSRRWCSMNACGSIVKMRRYRAARGFRGS
jgi:predicted RNA-binding Zn ribbon-like protein